MARSPASWGGRLACTRVQSESLELECILEFGREHIGTEGGLEAAGAVRRPWMPTLPDLRRRQDSHA